MGISHGSKGGVAYDEAKEIRQQISPTHNFFLSFFSLNQTEKPGVRPSGFFNAGKNPLCSLIEAAKPDKEIFSRN